MSGKKKKWVGILVALVMVLTMVPSLSWSEVGDETGDGTWTIMEMVNGDYWIIEYTGPEQEELTIPSTVGGKPVSGMQWCFRDHPTAKNWLKKVNIEFSGTIYEGFSGCTALEKVVLPVGGSMKFASTFENCINLHSINIEDLTSVEIKDFVFLRCENLKKVRLPEDAGTYIGQSAFEDSGLEEINFPDSLTEIYYRAFKNTKLKNTPGKTLKDGYTPCLYISDNVTRIGGEAFLGEDQQYTAVSIPKGLSKDVFKPGVTIEEREIEGKVAVSYNYGFDGSANEKAGDFPENTLYTIDKSTHPHSHSSNGWVPLQSDGTLDTGKLYKKGDTYQLGTEDVVFYEVKNYDPVIEHPEDSYFNFKIRGVPIYGNYQFPTNENVALPDYPTDEVWQDVIPAGMEFVGWKYNFTDEILQPGESISIRDAFLMSASGFPTFIPQFSMKPAPVITAGADSIWTKGSGTALQFVSDGDIEEFIKVTVDGIELVENADYTVAEGSTAVTLSPTYLETLAVGKHTMGIVSANGTAKTNFTIVTATGSKTFDSVDGKTAGTVGTVGIVKTVSSDKAPKTGDNSFMALPGILMILGAGIAVAAGRRREN